MKRSILTVLLLTSFAIALGAKAHGYVVRAIPADRSTLERPPTRLQYWFSEDLEPRFSEIKLRDQSGAIIATGGVDDINASLLTLRVPSGLPDGAYIVELRPAFVSDGHVVAESRVFFVGEEVGDVSGQAADDRAIPLEVFWRFLLSAANILFFGCSALYGAVLMPAWGSRRPTERGLPARVTRRLGACMVASITLAVAANVIALVQQSMVFFNTDAAQVIQQNLWQVVQIGSRFGDVWTFRMVLLIFVAVLLFTAEYLRETTPGLAVGIRQGMAWLGALFIGLSMITSHAAGSLVLPWFAILVNWIHALAVAFWVGGIATLALVLPAALQPYSGAERRQALEAVMRRFSKIAALMVLIVISTGVYNALNHFVTPDDLASSYGRSLGAKLLLVVLLLSVGARQHLALRPRLAARLRIPVQGRSFIAWLRIEGAIALIALLAVAWLSATPIPEPKTLQAGADTPRASELIGDITLSTAILPGGPGVNTYDMVLSRADIPVAEAEVYLQLVNPERGRRGPWLRAEAVEPGLYAAASDDIDSAGGWWSLIDIIGADGDTSRAAFAWQISEGASVQQTRDPNTPHLLALVLVMASLGVWVYAPARRLLARMRIGLASALIAFGAVAVTIAVLALGAALIAEQQREYERTLYPPPVHVNTALPDADSLNRGQALYLEHCQAWESETRDFRALLNQLKTAGDDFFYGVIGEGWRDLPPCTGDLDESERWDIVNYVRTFEERY